MEKYDYLIVGSGLYGATFAYLATQAGKKCRVIERRNHPGGNIYCEEIEGIHVHKYGAHIFHTSNKEVWNFVNSITEFNRYTNSPLANYKGKTYNLPFNMNTFYQMWGARTPHEAHAILEEQKREAIAAMRDKGIDTPRNLEEQALCLIGRDIYEKLIKGYTEKQWGRPCTELPAFIISRLPVRLVFDNNYFNDTYQGIPIGGYNKLIDSLLHNVDIHLNTDFIPSKDTWESTADKILYTGPLDELFGYRFGKLEYRSLSFQHEIHPVSNFQGNAVVNYTEKEIPYTRIIEHKHFEMFGNDIYNFPQTVISKEYPSEWKDGMEPYYPVNNEENNRLHSRYMDLANLEKKYIFGGRLAEYKYYDMHRIVELALEKARSEKLIA